MIKQKVRHNLVKNKFCVGAILYKKRWKKEWRKKDAPYLDSSIKHICSPRIVVPTAVFNFLCKGVIKIVAGYIIKATLSLEDLLPPDMVAGSRIVFANFLARRTIMPWWITLITIPSYAFIYKITASSSTVKLVLYQDVVLRCHVLFIGHFHF